MRTLVVVSGPPASGKSSLAAPLAERLGFALLAKDAVKESLFDTLGAGDASWSARLSDAAYAVLFALAPALPAAVLDANFRHEHRARLLAAGDGARLLEVHCVCADDERRRRWAARRRHPGHLDADRPTPPAPAAPGPLHVGELLELDTAGGVDVAAVAAWVRAHLPGAGG